MFVVGRFLEAMAWVLNAGLTFLFWVILINALLSWVRPDPNHAIVQFLDRVSDAVCNPIRRLIPTIYAGIDFAPFVAMLLIYFLKIFLVGSLRDMAFRMVG